VSAISVKRVSVIAEMRIVADSLLTTYHVKRRRAAMGPHGAEEAPARGH